MNLFELFAKISLDTTEYQKSVRDAKSESQGLSEKIKSVSKDSETLKNKVKVLASQYNEAKNKVSKLKDEFNKLAKETGATSKATQELAEKLKDAEKEANDLKEELESYSKSARNAQSSTSSFASKLGSGLKVAAKVGAAAVAAVATATVALTKSSIESFSDYEQVVGGVETLFKDSAGKVQEYANQAYKTANMSANRYMETVTSFSASLLQGLGGDTAKAADYADMAIRDMSDNANKFGTDISMIQNAYQGFAKKNYTMLDNLKLGYGGTASEMARLINDSGVLGDTVTVTASNINRVSFDKIIEAINKVQTEMGITGTTANEASTTIQGSFNSMSSAFENFMTSLSSGTGDVDEKFDALVESVGTYGENLLPRIRTTLSGLTALINGSVDDIELSDALKKEISGVFGSIKSLAGALGNRLLENGDDLLDTGIDLFTNILDGMAEGLDKANKEGKIKKFITDISDSLSDPSSTGSLIDAGIDLVDAIVDGISDPDTIVSLGEGAFNIVATLSYKLADVASENYQTAFDLGQDIGEKIGEGINDFLDDPKGWSEDVISKLNSKISEMWESALDWIENFSKEVEGSKTEEFYENITGNEYTPEVGQQLQNSQSAVKETTSNLSTYDKMQYEKESAALLANKKNMTDEEFRKALQKLMEKYGISGSHKNGLSYVPFDGYIAELHKGERVLTAKEAKNYNSGIGSSTINITINGAQYNSEESLAEAIAYEFQNMMNRRNAANA